MAPIVAQVRRRDSRGFRVAKDPSALRAFAIVGWSLLALLGLRHAPSQAVSQPGGVGGRSIAAASAAPAIVTAGPRVGHQARKGFCSLEQLACFSAISVMAATMFTNFGDCKSKVLGEFAGIVRKYEEVQEDSEPREFRTLKDSIMEKLRQQIDRGDRAGIPFTDEEKAYIRTYG